MNSSEELVFEEVEKQSKVKYGPEICPLCNTRINEYGFCACGAGAG